MQAAADGAAALRTIGRAAEDAGFNAAAEVGGIIDGHSGEDAIARILGRIQKRFCHAFRKEQFRKALGQRRKLAGNRGTMFRQEHFGALLANLRSVKADPDAVHLGGGIPKRDVFFQVAGAGEHLARNRPVDIDIAAGDVFQDAFVGGGLAADVVVFGQSVNGNGDADARDFHPFERNGNHSAGDHHCENSHVAEGRENFGKLAMADERFAADE